MTNCSVIGLVNYIDKNVFEGAALKNPSNRPFYSSQRHIGVVTA